MREVVNEGYERLLREPIYIAENDDGSGWVPGPVFTDRITLSSYDGVLKATAERNRVDALKAEEKLRRESDESHARWLERHPTCWKCHLAQNIWIPSQNRMGKWCKRQDKLVEDGPLCEWAQEQGGRRTGGI